MLASGPAHVDALAGITRIDGRLTLEGDVSSLVALGALTSIEGELVIRGTALASLAGLESLTEVDGVVIVDNASLPSCAAEALVGRLGLDPADAVVSGNDDDGVCP